MFDAPDGVAQTAGGSRGLPRHASVAVENAQGAAALVIACDHASNALPDTIGGQALAGLGLDAADLDRHIAWDPGALGLSRSLSRRLDAPLVAGRVSRLVLDTNRDPAAFDSIAETSEDTPVPGNVGLDGAARALRVRQIYDPFHAALAAMIEAVEVRAGRPAAMVGVHTFTPVYRGVARPWHVGVLFDRDRSLAAPLLRALRRETGLVVGENQPYSPSDRVYHTLDRHAQSQGRASVMIEVRNDLVAHEAGQEEWGGRLAAGLTAALAAASQREAGRS